MARIPTIALGPIQTGGIAFVRTGTGSRGAFVTVVARAHFRIVPGEAMRPIASPPLVAQPVKASDGRVLEPGDYAPYLPGAELIVVSSAPIKEPRPARIMITRQGTKIFAKAFTLTTFAALGPVIRRSPPDPSGPLLELDQSFDFRTYHAAPSDQILELFRGGESVVLDQVSNAHQRLQTWVPIASPATRLYKQGGGPTTAPMPLAMDRLTLDLDKMAAALTMRVCITVENDTALATVGAVVALDGPGAAWPQRFEAAKLDDIDPASTLKVDGDLGRMIQAAALPFAPAAGTPAIAVSSGPREAVLPTGTNPLEDMTLADVLAAEAPLPFGRNVAPSAAAASPPPPQRTRTVDLSTTVASDDAEPARSLPFREGQSSLAKPSGERKDQPLRAGATVIVDSPFLAPAPPPPPPAVPRPAFAGSDFAPRTAPVPAPPPVLGPAPASDEEKKTLGDHFLDAFEGAANADSPHRDEESSGGREEK